MNDLYGICQDCIHAEYDRVSDEYDCSMCMNENFCTEGGCYKFEEGTEDEYE